MKKNLNYEIYESYSKKRTAKKYIVVSLRADYDEEMKLAKRFFHCSEAHIHFTIGYVYLDKLYLEEDYDPHFLYLPDYRYVKGNKIVGVAYYVR